MKKLISIVTPAFNESENIDELYRRLALNFSSLAQYDFEVIVIENGSWDNSFEKLKAITKKDRRFKVIQFSRNFGCDGAITAGLQYASGEAVILMNADLQDPPEMIGEFIEKWEAGYEIVYGKIQKRHGVPLFRRIGTHIFYRIINYLTKGLFPMNVSDFRLISKGVCVAINKMPERNRMLRGMIYWTGFKQTGIPFERPPRFAGESKADFTTVFKLALDGIISFSYFPIRLVMVVGSLLIAGSLMLAVADSYLYLVNGQMIAGSHLLMILILFLFGMQFMFISMLGEYVARIYDEAKQRPIYIIKEEIGFKR